MIIDPCKTSFGEVLIPGDKSISHRAVMLGAIAEGTTVAENFLMSQDCLSTIECFRSMGVEVETLTPKPFQLIPHPSPLSSKARSSIVKVHGKGLRGLKSPAETLDAGNSGTTARLIMGILAGQHFEGMLDGDKSLRNRPMSRVIEPLTQMGASIQSTTGGRLPLKVKGGSLSGITYTSPISSAQIKSSILLASLYAESPTIFTEPFKSRNHTELMLKQFGGELLISENTITSSPVNRLVSQHITIAGDISSAAFFITLGLVIPNSQIIVRNVGLNPTRTGIIDIYLKMGANIKIENYRKISNEPVGDLIITESNLKGAQFGGEIIPRLIDEIPVIVVAATQAHGTTVIKDAAELKVKESNRIKSITTELAKMGANIVEANDGMIIEGPTKLQGTSVDSHNDHRIAMALAVAAKTASGQTTICNFKCVDISFPSFFEQLEASTIR